jgi:hypothetical protein
VRWSANRERPVDTALPVARFLLLHTLSHLLIRQVSLECGYSSSSIRERLYVGTPQEPATGILLSTAASDSEGTLGGLVALANPTTSSVCSTRPSPTPAAARRTRCAPSTSRPTRRRHCTRPLAMLASSLGVLEPIATA